MNYIILNQVEHICESSINQIHKTPYHGLVTGEVGLAYLCGVLYQETEQERYYQWLQKCITSLNIKDSISSDISLGYGKAGYTWLLARLQKMEFILDAKEIIEYNLEIIKKQCEIMMYKDDFDYFKGALGLLYTLYDVGKLDQELATDFCSLVEKKYSADNPNRLEYKSIIEYDLKKIETMNLGTPHGITGIALFLLMLKENKFQDVDNSIRNILELFIYIYNKIQKANSFPMFISPNNDHDYGKRSPLSWCYGDIYIIYAFKKGGLLLNDSKYEDFANELLINTIQRRRFRHDNLSLCHGVNSISFGFDRLYKLFNTPELREVSKMWQEQSVTVFNTLYKEFEESNTYNHIFDNTSLINGFPGTVLSFLDIGEEIEINWNFLLVK